MAAENADYFANRLLISLHLGVLCIDWQLTLNADPRAGNGDYSVPTGSIGATVLDGSAGHVIWPRLSSRGEVVIDTRRIARLFR
jgi:hypothetical protein